VSLEKIRQNINLGLINPLEGSSLDNNPLRPSIETTLHALMPHTVVLHTHPVELLSLIVQKNSKFNLTKIFYDLNWSWVDYARPGIELTRNVHAVLNGKKSDILILENHGLVVGGRDCEEAMKLIEKVIECCKKNTRIFQDPDELMLIKYAQKLNMIPARNNIIHALAMDNSVNKYCHMKSTILYPDQAVFLGPRLNCINANDFLSFSNQEIPYNYVILNGIGVFIAKNSKPEIEDMLTCHAEILLRIPPGTELSYLSTNDVNMLIDWEAEKYRQNLEN